MTTGTRHGDAGLTIGRETMQPIYDFVDGAVKEQKPFFVWYAPFLPHTPHTPPERLLKKYLDKSPDEGTRQVLGDVRMVRRNVRPTARLPRRPQAPRQHAGRLRHRQRLDSRPADNNRAKQSPFDFGLRTPITLRLPGKIEPQRERRVRDVDRPRADDLESCAASSRRPRCKGIDLLDAKAVAARKQIFGEIFTHNAVDVDVPASSLRFRWARDGKLEADRARKAERAGRRRAVVRRRSRPAGTQEPRGGARRRRRAIDGGDGPVVGRGADEAVGRDEVTLSPVVHDRATRARRRRTPRGRAG